MPVHNADIAAIFTEIADLLEIQGANPFRIRAYRRYTSLRPAGGCAGGEARELRCGTALFHRQQGTQHRHPPPRPGARPEDQ